MKEHRSTSWFQSLYQDHMLRRSKKGPNNSINKNLVSTTKWGKMKISLAVYYSIQIVIGLAIKGDWDWYLTKLYFMFFASFFIPKLIDPPLKKLASAKSYFAKVKLIIVHFIQRVITICCINEMIMAWRVCANSLTIRSHADFYPSTSNNQNPYSNEDTLG